MTMFLPVSLFPFVSALLLVGTAEAGQRFAVIVAGAKDYNNYFSQANACHYYDTLRDGGIPASNIIHLNYDDVAHDPLNPFPDNLVNRVQGPNIYPECQIDYRGRDVTPEVFLNVLTGNKSAIREITGRDGPVLESGPDDDVFVFMSDHGWPGAFMFPTSQLLASDLQQALQMMHATQMYNRMLLKIDCCFSGSMLAGLLPDNMNIYATTSTNPHEPGLICCHDLTRQAYVGTFYTVGSAYAVDVADRNNMTQGQLYQKEVDACKGVKYMSHRQQYGNLTMANLVLSVFMGSTQDHQHYKTNYEKDGLRFTPDDEDSDIPDFLKNPPMDMARMATIKLRLMSKTLTDQQRRELTQELDITLKVKKVAEDIFRDIAEIVADDTGVSTKTLTDSRQLANNVDCYKQALDQIRAQCPSLELQKYPFISRNFFVLINACNRLDSQRVSDAISKITSLRKECVCP